MPPEPSDSSTRYAPSVLPTSVASGCTSGMSAIMTP